MPDIVCISPVDGREVVRRPSSSAAEIEAAVAAARKAQAEWKRVPSRSAGKILSKAVDAMLAMRAEVGPELAWQMGRPVRYGGERAWRLRGTRARHDRDGRERARRIVPEPKAGFKRYIAREPVGIVLTVAPWNYPYLTAVNSVVPALMAGNAVLLKHAAQTLLVGDRFQAAMDHAGLPKGLFRTLTLQPRGHHEADRLRRGGSDLLHRLGRGRTGDRARGGRHLRGRRARAWRQGPGLCAARRGSRARGREHRRRRVLQFRAMLLRHRARLCACRCLRQVRRRLRRPDEAIRARRSARSERPRSGRWRSRALPRPCAIISARRCTRARRR